MTSPAPRVGIAGTGAWGLNHVRVFGRVLGCLDWIFDPSPEAAARAVTLHPGVGVAASFDDLLAKPVDAIVIATPAITHADLACRAMIAGKHVLIEKPLALSTRDAERVIDTSVRTGRTAMVGHLMLFHPALERLRASVRDGELGALRYVHATRVNLGRLRSDENALWSFGPHDLSMMDYLVGEQPEAVAAHGAAFLQPGIEDVVFLTLRYASGLIGHVHLSWIDPRKERRLTVVGANKMAEFDDVAATKLRLFDRGYDRPPSFTQYGEYLTIRHGEVTVPDLPGGEPLERMNRHFVACCGGEPCRTPASDGLRIVRILAAAQLSLRGRGTLVEVSGV